MIFACVVLENPSSCDPRGDVAHRQHQIHLSTGREIQTGLKVGLAHEAEKVGPIRQVGCCVEGKGITFSTAGRSFHSPRWDGSQAAETGLQLFSGGSQGRKALKLLLKASGAENENAHEAAAQVVRADCMEAVSACREQESLVHLLIAAAGSGRRMGADCNKLLLPLLGRPVLAWTLEAAFAASDIRWIGVIGQSLDQAAIAPLLEGAPKPVVWIQGEPRARNRSNAVWRRFPAMPSMCSFMMEPAVWSSPRCSTAASGLCRKAAL